MVDDDPSLARDAVGSSTPTVKDVLGFRSDELGQRPDLLAAVCQEGDVLVRLQTLALEHVDEPALWLAVVAMREHRWVSSHERRGLSKINATIAKSIEDHAAVNDNRLTGHVVGIRTG